jgi:hypothetical protein
MRYLMNFLEVLSGLARRRQASWPTPPTSLNIAVALKSLGCLTMVTSHLVAATVSLAQPASGQEDHLRPEAATHATSEIAMTAIPTAIPVDHRVCSATGFSDYVTPQAFASALLFSGIDIGACARHLHTAITGNYLVLNFDEFDTLMALADLQRRQTRRTELFSGPFTCPPDTG